MRPTPFDLKGVPTELLWPATTDDDEVGRWARDRIRAIAATPPGARRRPSR